MKRNIRMGWVLMAAALLVFLAAAILWNGGFFAGTKPAVPANALMVIAPYYYKGTWVFDDPEAGLQREPFVAGVPEMIDEMVKDIPGARDGFRLLFAAQPFPGYAYKFTWRRGDQTGNWYYCEHYQKEGWLCPALLKYYQQAPQEIYVKVEPLK